MNKQTPLYQLNENIYNLKKLALLQRCAMHDRIRIMTTAVTGQMTS